MGSFASAIVAGWIDEIAAKTTFMSLFASDPSATGSPSTVEVVGGLYSRQPVVWTRTGPALLTLGTGLTWHNLPPGAVIAAVGGFDDAFAGVYLFSDLLPSPISYPAGGTYVLPAGEYELGLNELGPYSVIGTDIDGTPFFDPLGVPGGRVLGVDADGTPYWI